MSTSSIEWTDTTWNPVRGCRKVSPGCKNCYAETMAKRLRAMGQAGYLRVIDDRGRWTGEFETDSVRLAEPLGWKKPRRVFVNSMSDLFGESVPFEFVAAVFGVMAATPRHTYQVLTKRPEAMLTFFAWAKGEVKRRGYGQPEVCMDEAAERGVNVPTTTVDEHGFNTWPLPNVWLGVSTEDQATADERIPLLLQAPAAVRFISAEPLLGPIDLSPWLFWDFCQTCEKPGNMACVCRGVGPVAAGVRPLDWVIAGGESGPGARRCDIMWIKSIIEQCAETDVACFVKQLGADPWLGVGGLPLRRQPIDGRVIKDPKGGDPAEWPEDLRVRQWPREVAHAG